MKFVEHALDVLNPQADGRVVAIVQMSCAIKNDKDLKAVKRRILAKHHLKSVLSMPDDLFYPIGVVTCIMVFEANKTNAGRKTWFGYFKDDGFEKRKHLGRIDARNKYTDIKKQWLAAYLNADQTPGLSVRKEVTAEDEWCAEAYLETDYSSLSDSDFIRKMRDYAAFLVQNGSDDFWKFIWNGVYDRRPRNNTQIHLQDRQWKGFTIKSFCDWPYKATAYNAIELQLCLEDSTNTLPYITRTDVNNGCKSFVVKTDDIIDIEEANAITIGDTTATIYYQEKDFICGDHMVVLRSTHFNKYVGLFIITLLNKERFRYNYGRAFNKDIIANTELKLPVVPNTDIPDWQFMEDYIKSLPYSANM